MFQSSVGEGSNSWELDGNDVILQSTVVVRGVCRFSDAGTAQKWFRLQLGYARNGSTSEWGELLFLGVTAPLSRAGTSTVTGDWFQTVRSWRRFERGQVQKAGSVEGTTSIVVCAFRFSSLDLCLQGDSHPTARGLTLTCRNVG